MGLRRQGMVKRTSGTTALSYTVPAGHSAIVRDIHMYNAAVGTEDIRVTVDRRMIQNWIAASGMWNLGEMGGVGIQSCSRALRQAGIYLDLPLGPGQELAITAPGTADYITAVFDLHDEGDHKPEDRNGSNSKRYTLLQMVSNSEIVTAAGDWNLDQSDINSVFPAFPGGDNVPSGVEMALQAIYGCPVRKGKATPTHTQNTTHLRFLKDREDIFDPDLGGLNWLATVTAADAVVYESACSRAHCGQTDNPPRIIMVEPEIVFAPGEELNVIATVAEAATAGDLAAGDIKVGLVFDVRPVA